MIVDLKEINLRTYKKNEVMREVTKGITALNSKL
jgi:hypothetical protein